MSNRIIELHDSEIASIELRADMGIIHFSVAYIHQSVGVPGVEAGIVSTQEAELTIKNAILPDLPQSKPYRVDDGTLLLGSIKHSNEIPIPLLYKGPTAIALLIADSDYQYSKIEISGSGIELKLIGEAKYIESFPAPAWSILHDLT